MMIVSLNKYLFLSAFFFCLLAFSMIVYSVYNITRNVHKSTKQKDPKPFDYTTHTVEPEKQRFYISF